MAATTNTIRWGTAASVGIDRLSSETVHRVARRWCGTAEPAETAGYRLELPPLAARSGEEVSSIAMRIRYGSGGEPLEVRIGPHAVVLGDGGGPDRIVFSLRRPPSPTELDLLIDMGVNHLLARQGLPVLHSCSFSLAGSSVLGLGESFAGKTTVSVAAMRAGGRVVSDDVALVLPDEAGVYSLRPVRSFGWLRGRTREIVPGELREKMTENDEGGQPRWVLSRESFGTGFIDDVAPNVAWIQSIDRRLRESRIEPVDQGQVFAALIRASSPLFLSRHCPEIRDRLIPVFRALCAQCRGYRVRLAPRLLEEPEEEIMRLLELSRQGS